MGERKEQSRGQKTQLAKKKKNCSYKVTLLKQQSVYQVLGNYFTEALK